MAPDGRDRYGPRTVVLRGDGFHRGQNVQALLGVRLAFFIAHRPHEDAGMIAVAPHQIGELAQAFGVRRHHARLVEHQHAQLVAGVEQFRRGRIVRGAQRSCSPSPAACGCGSTARSRAARRPLRRGPGDCRCPSASRLAVQKEALLRVELDGANAEGRFVAIDDFAADLDLGHQLVEVALLERPEERPAAPRSPVRSSARLARGIEVAIRGRLFRPRCRRDREWSR